MDLISLGSGLWSLKQRRAEIGDSDEAARSVSRRSRVVAEARANKNKIRGACRRASNLNVCHSKPITETQTLDREEWRCPTLLADHQNRGPESQVIINESLRRPNEPLRQMRSLAAERGVNFLMTDDRRSSRINGSGPRQARRMDTALGSRARRSRQAGYWATTNAPWALALGLLLTLLAASSVPVNGIRLQPEGKEKFYWSGETFVITCQNSNNIKNVKIRWVAPSGQLVTENRSARIHAETSGPHGSRLVVFNATLLQDEGTYKCTIGSADDARPRETIEFALRLLKATNFKSTQPKLALTTGKSAEIDCHVEFDPNVSPGTVSWYKNGQPVDAQADASVQVVEYNADKQLSQLILSPVRREHEGVYTCQAVSVTPQLSKLNNFDIQLDINYAPIFDQLEQTIWVESSQALANRLAANGLSPTHSGHRGDHGAGNVFKSHKHAGRLRQQQSRHQETALDESSSSQSSTPSTTQGDDRIVRVELRCVCQANPPASIMWFTKSNYQIVVSKGQPAHVVEEPSVEVQTHNTTSTLIVAYNLDNNWPLRNDEYKCSAANSLGEASKKFTIEQGNPPPAFSVGPHKSYNSESAMFEFTLLGPNFDPLGSSQQQQKEIVPSVDAFRIRAEFGFASNSLPSQSGASELISPANRHADMIRRQAEPSVQFSYPQASGDKPAQQRYRAQQQQTWRPQSFNISLSKLPTGMQRLYLEAHNAVGWSPNATHLGDFYLVSGTFNLLPSFVLLFICQIAAMQLVARFHLYS